jgi:glycosyltransferase involved in cell wall biosynthesis
MEFLKARRPAIIAAAFAPKLLDGVDLYGLDMCLQLLAELKKDYPQAGVLLALAQCENGSDTTHMSYLYSRSTELGIDKDVHWLIGCGEIWPLFRHADVFVRPTAADSFGISVAEAISVGTSAVASDVCQRAEGAILFRSRDQDDFKTKVLRALASKGFEAGA